MKVNGTEDLQDNANGEGRRTRGERGRRKEDSHTEEEEGDIIKGDSNRVGGRR